MKRGIDKAVIAVVEELEKSSKPCDDDKSVAQVGTISANADTAIGDIIAKAMGKVGKEGVITVEEGSVSTTNWILLKACNLTVVIYHHISSTTSNL